MVPLVISLLVALATVNPWDLPDEDYRALVEAARTAEFLSSAASTPR